MSWSTSTSILFWTPSLTLHRLPYPTETRWMSFDTLFFVLGGSFSMTSIIVFKVPRLLQLTKEKANPISLFMLSRSDDIYLSYLEIGLHICTWSYVFTLQSIDHRKNGSSWTITSSTSTVHTFYTLSSSSVLLFSYLRFLLTYTTVWISTESSSTKTSFLIPFGLFDLSIFSAYTTSEI